MFTRCSACHTVHPLNATLLVQGGGKYRCGKCSKLNNALKALFDEWPDAGQAAPTEGQMPTLGNTLASTPLAPGDNSDLSELGEESTAAAKNNWSRTIWISGACVLVLVTALNLAWFFRVPLMESPLVLENPLIRDRLVSFGLVEEPPVQPQGDLSQLRLITSDLRSHPSINGALRLNVTIMNQATGIQAYPKLEVLLLDELGMAITSRVFEPSEYLAEDADIEGGMTPEAYLPIVLDLSDPGRQAIGFEIRIR